MLKFDNKRTLAGHDVHGDDDPNKQNVFYVMPKFPTFARLENGGAALRFIEYTAVRKVGEAEFGGFVSFNTDLTISDTAMNEIRAGVQAELQNRFGANAPTAALQTVGWVSGAVRLVLLEDGKFIKSIHGATSPSLTTGNTAVFFMELDLVATAAFKKTLSGGAGSAINVVYDLDYYARLPESHAWGTWHASSFYSFFQSVDIDESIWSEDTYTEVQSTTRYKNEVTETHFELVGDPSLPPDKQAELELNVHNWITTQLEEGVKRNLLEAVAAVDPSVKNLTEDQDFENVTRSISNTQISDVNVDYREAKAILHQIHPQGMLPAVTSLTDKNGQALKWEDYYVNISVDEFLRTLAVSVMLDTKLEPYGISLVKVTVNYPHGENAKVVDPVFTPANQGTPQKFEFIVSDKIRSYLWSYEVHFEDDVPPFTSKEVESSDPNLVVKLANLPVLKLDVIDGDINFQQVSKARVRVRYEGGTGQPIERFFNFTEAEANVTHELLEVLAEPRSGVVSHQTTYTMKGDGREITGPLMTTDTDVISIDDPFHAPRTVTFTALGDLTAVIKDITIQATYEEPDNGYRQDFSVLLSGEGKTTDDWKFPTIDESRGRLSYRAVIRRRDGTTQEVEETDAKGGRFDIGDKFAARLTVNLRTGLLAWDQLKMVNVSLRYDGADPPVTDDFLFKADTGDKTWDVPVTDADLSTYKVTVTFFMADGSRRTSGPTEQNDESVFLEIPPA